MNIAQVPGRKCLGGFLGLIAIAGCLALFGATEPASAPPTPPTPPIPPAPPTHPATQTASQPATQPQLGTALPHLKPLKDKEMILLYSGTDPDAKGTGPQDVPTLEVHLPPQGVKATGSAMIVLPGGGYSALAEHEGGPPANWLAKNGITAFVLRYRYHPKYHHPVPLNDAQRALRYVRAHATEWQLKSDHIGILGFSAGGHLASTAATHVAVANPNAADPVEQVSSRPDVQVLLYPVISMGPVGHGSSRICLIGEHPSPELVQLLSNEQQVSSATPPAYLVHSTTDHVVPIANSDQYAAALKKFKIPFEYQRGDFGEHGFGAKPFWTDPCLIWLRKQGF